MVYKLVEVRGHPRIKLSNEKDKITIPARKNIYRLYNSEGKSIMDVMQTSTEPAPVVGERFLASHPFDEKLRAYVTPAKVVSLLELFFDGALVKPIPNIHESRALAVEQMGDLRPDIMRALNPTPYKVSVSQGLFNFITEIWLRDTPIPEINH
jgi:nicotinate phosphoribosyltransferase